MQVPLIQTTLKELMLVQTKWRSILNPLLGNPSLDSLILENVSLLKAAPNVVNHKLGRKLIGWRVVRIRAKAIIYDSQDSNQTPDLTLVLITDTDVIVNLEVF